MYMCGQPFLGGWQWPHCSAVQPAVSQELNHLQLKHDSGRDVTDKVASFVEELGATKLWNCEALCRRWIDAVCTIARRKL